MLAEQSKLVNKILNRLKRCMMNESRVKISGWKSTVFRICECQLCGRSGFSQLKTYTASRWSCSTPKD